MSAAVRLACAFPGCARRAHAKRYCSTHYARLLRHGDVKVLAPTGRPLKGDVPTAAAIHKRLTRTLGAARERTCVDCGARAAEWSYDGRDEQELRGPMGRATVRYSLDLAHYEPRCVSCHRKFDGAGDRPRTASGAFARRKDGAQIVTVIARKRYADTPGVHVRVDEYSPPPNERKK